jgi:hypothetical protein
MWVTDRNERIQIDEVVAGLQVEGIPTWQCENANVASTAIEAECKLEGRPTLDVHPANCIGFMTGEGTLMNRGVQIRVLNRLRSYPLLDPSVFVETASNDPFDDSWQFPTQILFSIPYRQNIHRNPLPTQNPLFPSLLFFFFITLQLHYSFHPSPDLPISAFPR